MTTRPIKVNPLLDGGLQSSLKSRPAEMDPAPKICTRQSPTYRERQSPFAAKREEKSHPGAGAAHISTGCTSVKTAYPLPRPRGEKAPRDIYTHFSSAQHPCTLRAAHTSSAALAVNVF